MEILEEIYNELTFEQEFKKQVLQESREDLEDAKLWFGSYDAYRTLDNPLTVRWGHEIDESLIKTYPVEAAKKHICQFFNLPERYFQICRNKYNTYCFISFPQKGNSLDEIIKAMEWYGYTCVVKNPQPHENGWYTLKFESNFEKNANELLKDETHLIHLTDVKNKERIEKQGFVPKSNNQHFNYTDRVYFMLGSADPIETLDLAKKLKQVKYGYDAQEKRKYCAFRIDVSKIPENVTFHVDPNKGGAIWTSDNVTPNAIKDCMIFEV